jgi:hypothetical protein
MSHMKNFTRIVFAILIFSACSSTQKTPSAEVAAQPVVDTRMPATSEHTYDIYGFKVPLHNLEQVPKEEPGAIGQLNEIMLGLFRKEYTHPGGTVDGATGMVVPGTRRGVHPRSHGCAIGTLKVGDALKQEAGIFVRGASYPITARFSNGSPKVQGDDSSVDTRGFAMKVHNVPGQTLLGQNLGLGEEVSQDFTLNSSEPFFSDNADRYSQFMRILTFDSKDLVEAGTKFIKKLALDGHPIVAAKVANAFVKIRDVKATTPLGINYFSITPFQFGESPDAPIVKYMIEPCKGQFNDPVAKDDPYFLHNNLKRRMAKYGGCFKFKIQTRASDWNIEDGTYAWPQKKSPYVEVARIEFPAQELMPEETCEKLVINPWNTLAAHKPVGGINRIRLPTYILSVQKRRETNKY